VGALSYAALYHPWTYAREGGRMPPDGGVAGMLAARAATRGAWVAAANEPLRDVTALSPRVARGDLQRLQDGRVNEVRQEPHGFLLLDQDTLSRDDDVRPLNVRRLLCLLRRLALLHGPQFVFEPNDATLRRSIQLRFEELLGLMFDLGAFAGATRAQGFQVVTGNPPNTPQSIDEGELIVELKVAPSRPLAFLTVRLVNAAYGLRVEGA
jgi:phage tail sheath protein FI